MRSREFPNASASARGDRRPHPAVAFAAATLIAGLLALLAGTAAARSVEPPPRPGALPLEVDGVMCGWLCVPDAKTSCGDGRPHIDGCPVLQRYFETTPGGLSAALGLYDRERARAVGSDLPAL